MMTVMTMPAPGGWTVTGQTQGSMIADNGQVVDVYTVTFRTGAGVIGSVRIPVAQYTKQVVRAAIAEHAAVLDEVAGLSSDGAGS